MAGSIELAMVEKCSQVLPNYPFVAPTFRLQCRYVCFASSDTNGRGDIGDENLTVADLPRLGGSHDGTDDQVEFLGFADHFEFHFRNEVDRILGTTVYFRVTFLATESAHFANRHPQDALFGQCVFNIFQLESSDYCFNFFHVFALKNGLD